MTEVDPTGDVPSQDRPAQPEIDPATFRAVVETLVPILRRGAKDFSREFVQQAGGPLVEEFMKHVRGQMPRIHQEAVNNMNGEASEMARAVNGLAASIRQQTETLQTAFLIRGEDKKLHSILANALLVPDEDGRLIGLAQLFADEDDDDFDDDDDDGDYDDAPKPRMPRRKAPARR